jgi:hypothetical protein
VEQGDDRRDEVVCRRERVVGSHIKKRVCMTRAQTEDLRAASQDTISDLNRATTRSEGDGGA